MIRKKIKVAAYARVSTDKDDQLNSLDNQRIYFQNYIKGHPDWEFVDVYCFFCKNTLLFCTFWCIILIDRFVQKSTLFKTSLNVDK